ncbi:hypothetical protein GCM10027414_13870 [Humibacter ginsengiterrae]
MHPVTTSTAATAEAIASGRALRGITAPPVLRRPPTLAEEVRERVQPKPSPAGLDCLTLQWVVFDAVTPIPGGLRERSVPLGRRDGSGGGTREHP